MAARKRSADRAEPELGTLQQLSQESGVPYTSVRDLVLRGYLTRVQIGDSNRIWVRRKEFRRLIDSGTSGT